MNIDLIIRIGAIGLLLAALNIVLKKAGREEIADLVTLAGVVIVVVIVFNEVWNLFENIRGIFGL